MFIQESTRLIYNINRIEKLFSKENLINLGLEVNDVKRKELNIYEINTKFGWSDFYYMPCRPDLENCIQINIIHNIDKGVDEILLKDFFKSELEKLRKNYNGKQIIGDNDLNFKFLK